MPKSLAILRALAEKFSLQLKDFGISSTNILIGSQFSICACLSLIRVACPVGPLSLSLLMRFEICDSVCISQMLLRLRILLWWIVLLGKMLHIPSLFLSILYNSIVSLSQVLAGM